MKKILIFSHEFHPFGGGAGVVAKHYAKKLSDEGNEITVLTKQIENIEVHSFYLKPFQFLPDSLFSIHSSNNLYFL